MKLDITDLANMNNFSYNISVSKSENGISVTISQNVYNTTGPEKNSSESKNYVFEGTVAEIQAAVESTLGFSFLA